MSKSVGLDRFIFIDCFVRGQFSERTKELATHRPLAYLRYYEKYYVVKQRVQAMDQHGTETDSYESARKLPTASKQSLLLFAQKPYLLTCNFQSSYAFLCSSHLLRHMFGTCIRLVLKTLSYAAKQVCRTLATLIQNTYRFIPSNLTYVFVIFDVILGDFYHAPLATDNYAFAYWFRILRLVKNLAHSCIIC